MRFIDASVFIYHLAGDLRHGLRAREIVRRVERGEETATSTLVVQQVTAYLRRQKKPRLTATFLAAVKNLEALVKAETLYTDFTAAAALQAKTGLSGDLWDDLVIAAQMERLGVKEIYSADGDFDLIPGVKRVF
ncbi:MAG: type II toxin-antitoxin system VapC family toxin [Halobacteria archaeon]